MTFSRPDTDVFIPDSAPMPEALRRTTHLCIGAHQDDQEFMAYHGIAACFQSPDHWFTGVCMTNGGGSSRSGPYANYSDEQMMTVRRLEQRKAARVGEYACEIQLAHPSAHVKDAANTNVVDDLFAILDAARPDLVYLHNPADKHDTHIATMLRSLTALRRLPAGQRPSKVYGVEIWRSLDWLGDDAKQVLDVSAHPNLKAALSGVFDSQITGGKRYDAASAGRHAANATFFESHATDTSDALQWAIDLTPLVTNSETDVAAYTAAFIERFKTDVINQIEKLSKP